VFGIGLLAQSKHKKIISMVIFQPNSLRKIYSKQLPHSDEFPYFEKGKEQIIVTIDSF